MNEIWKDIQYIDCYQVSTFGNIRNSKTKRVLKLSTIFGGYNVITIAGKTYSVHRIVGITFIPNIENKPTINHIDKVRDNNNILNLEWSTYREQALHSPTLNSNNKKGVWKIDVHTKERIFKYETIKEASLLTIGYVEGYKEISACALGKTETAFDYIWEYDKYETIPNEEWKSISIQNKKKLRIIGFQIMVE